MPEDPPHRSVGLHGDGARRVAGVRLDSGNVVPPSIVPPLTTFTAQLLAPLPVLDRLITKMRPLFDAAAGSDIVSAVVFGGEQMIV